MNEFSQARLTGDAFARLLDTQTECVVSWIDGKGRPVSAVQTYLWRQDALWVTAYRDRPRVKALKVDPHSAVCVSSAGTELPVQQMASARTLAVVHTDGSTGGWFYPAFCERAFPQISEKMAVLLAKQDRVIIELRPQTWNTFDGSRLRASVRR
ncbi:hypothetical protein [Mycobacterium sp. pR1184]|uniref:hypothetical protein n=1 Tax=Mycobacterium sp. pR1184 TaxID=3238981 RepID=UPI00351BC2E8